jgi:hypothetical protein
MTNIGAALASAIGGCLIAAIVALWRMQVKRADECERKHELARKGLLDLTAKVGVLEGKDILASEIGPKLDNLVTTVEALKR